MREREICYSASGKYISTVITQFPAKRKIPHNTQNCAKNFYLENYAKSVLLYDLPINMDLEICAHILLYGLSYMAQEQQEEPSKQPWKSFPTCLDFHALFPLL